MDLQTEQTGIIIPSIFLWGILLVSLLIFIGLTMTLLHHWKYYGIHDNPNTFIKSLHFFGSIVLFLIMVVALLVYETNVA